MGARIRAIREAQRLTQAQVADRLGLTEGGYRAYEAGRSEPSFTSIPDLADALGVHPAEFFLDESDTSVAVDALVGTPAFNSPLGRELRAREFARTMLPAWQELTDDQQQRIERVATPAVERLGEVLLSFGAELLRDERAG